MSEIDKPIDPEHKGRIRTAVARLLFGDGGTLPGVVEGHGSVEDGDPGDGVIVDGHEPPEPAEPPDSTEVDDDTSA